MSIELLYTSAPQGLKQGSRGFCTVLSTVGLPINLAQRLESLSGYRHLYQPGEQRDSDNPVCYSHLKLNVGGMTVSILSRITAYGVDYSQRTNKIAHHVVLDGSMPACGPATVLAQPGIMRSQWDGQCHTLPVGPAIPAISSSSAPCRLWEQVTGDAGWAGVVANAWMQPSVKPTWVIFSESQSQSMLALMREAISILPESKRWQATFSTYCTNLPPDVDCRVRCVVAGSDEARMAIARGTVLDITKGLGEPPASLATTAARDGIVVGDGKRIPSIVSPSAAMADDLKDDDLQSLIDAVDGSTNRIHGEDIDMEVRLSDLAQVPPSLLRSKSSRSVFAQPTINSSRFTAPPQSKKVLYSIIGAVSFFVAIAIIAGLYTVLSPVTSPPDEVIVDGHHPDGADIAMPPNVPPGSPALSSTDPTGENTLQAAPPPPPKFAVKFVYAPAFADEKVAIIHEREESKNLLLGKLQLFKDDVNVTIDKSRVIFQNTNQQDSPGKPSWILVSDDGTVTCTVNSIAPLKEPEALLNYKLIYSEGGQNLSDSLAIKLINDDDPDISFTIVDAENKQSDLFVPGTTLKPKFSVDSDADEVDSSRQWKWYHIDTTGNPIDPTVSATEEYTLKTNDLGKRLQLQLKYKSTNLPPGVDVTVSSTPVSTLRPAIIKIQIKDLLEKAIGSISELQLIVEVPLPVLIDDDDKGLQLEFSGSTSKRSSDRSKVDFRRISFDQIRKPKTKPETDPPLLLLADAKLATELLTTQIQSYKDTLTKSESQFFERLKGFKAIEKQLDAKSIPADWELRRGFTQVLNFLPQNSNVAEQLEFFIRWKSLSRVLKCLDELFDLEYSGNTEKEKSEEESRKERREKIRQLRENVFVMIDKELSHKASPYYTRDQDREHIAAIKEFAEVWRSLDRKENSMHPNASDFWNQIGVSFNTFERSILHPIGDSKTPFFIGDLVINEIKQNVGSSQLAKRPMLILTVEVMATVEIDDEGSIRSKLRKLNDTP